MWNSSNLKKDSVSGLRVKRDSISTLLFVMSLFSVCFLSGCGGGAESVPSGTVSGTIKVNGKALTQGRVNFVSSTTGTGAYADLKDDGSYEIPGEVPVGDYRVYITSVGLGDAPPSETGNPELKDALKDVPKKYQGEQTTDLQAAVKEGENAFDFDLKS